MNWLLIIGIGNVFLGLVNLHLYRKYNGFINLFSGVVCVIVGVGAIWISG